MLWRILEWACRLGLGGVFLYAGFVKVYPRQNQLAFAMDVSTYQLLPEWGVIVVSEALPWLELGLAVWLLSGWKLRYSAGVMGGLLVAFVGIMWITYARGIEANCGCFGSGEPISPRTLIRDSLLLLPAVFLAVAAWRRPEEPAPAS